MKEAPPLYLRIADNIEQQIRNSVWSIGDKLPSLRKISRMHSVSQSTAIQAYHHLETRALIEARPQSGYFVSNSFLKKLAVPGMSSPEQVGERSIEEIIERVYNSSGKTDVQLSMGVPDTGLLPVAKLNKAMLQAMREMNGAGTSYEEVQGNEKLRKQIAQWAFKAGALGHSDIITTMGCINAVSYCLMALTKPGDTIVVESPVYFGIIQLAKSLGLRIVELPTHPETGIHLEALKKTLASEKVHLCLLVSNFSNPMGSCMPDEHKREVVRLIQQYNIPLIEDDIYGDVWFGAARPGTCKSFDESGLVLWCGSVSKTLAPGYRVGWVAPGKFKEQVLRMKLFHSISNTSITHQAVANFMETGAYESHLRKLRNTLHANSLQYIRAIASYFPPGTKLSRPQGGFVIWIELEGKKDTYNLYEKAIRQGISFAPGRIFTGKKQFDNCLRLNFGMPWNKNIDAALMKLGTLSKNI